MGGWSLEPWQILVIFFPILLVWTMVIAFSILMKRYKCIFMYPIMVFLNPIIYFLTNLYALYSWRHRSWGGPRMIRQSVFQSLSRSLSRKLSRKSVGSTTLPETATEVTMDAMDSTIVSCLTKETCLITEPNTMISQPGLTQLRRPSVAFAIPFSSSSQSNHTLSSSLETTSESSISKNNDSLQPSEISGPSSTSPTKTFLQSQVKSGDPEPYQYVKPSDILAQFKLFQTRRLNNSSPTPHV